MPPSSIPPQEYVWSKCSEHLQQSLPPSDFVEYIQPLRPVWSGNNLTLCAPNIYVTERAAHFHQEITDALVSVGVDCAIHFQKSSPAPVSVVDNNRSANADKTFERFIVGECNRRVFEVAQNVTRQALGRGSPGASASNANLVIFLGSVGVGKTHLLHAINHTLQAQNMVGVEYVQAESFRREVVRSIREKDIQLLMHRLASLNLLLLDDLHWLAGAKKCQLEVLCLLERLVSERDAQVVITCGRHPADITGLEGRLADRLAGGLVVPFRPHTETVRSGLLLQRAADGGRSISPEVALRAATCMDDKATGRSIAGIMKQLCLTDAGQPISWQEIDDALMRRRKTCRVSVERILQTAAAYYETSPGVLAGKKRTRSAVNARHVAMYLCRDMTAASYSEIATAFSHRHHTAVMHACRKISKQIQSDVKLAQDMQNIKRRLTEK